MSQSPKHKLSRPLTMREVADLLELQGPDRVRLARRRLRQIEHSKRRDGVSLLLKSGEGCGTRYHTTLGLLVRHCPELQGADRRDVLAISELRDLWLQRFEKMAEDFAELRTVVIRRVNGLGSRVRKLETSRHE